MCFLVALADGAIIAGAHRAWYLSLNRPFGTAPNWVFAPVWTALYASIGFAGWLVWRRSIATWPLRLWGWQLAANALWTPAFFALRNPPLALLVSCALLVLVVMTIRSFARLRPAAAWLMAPYLAWTGYATYLTAGFWWLNPT